MAKFVLTGDGSVERSVPVDGTLIDLNDIGVSWTLDAGLGQATFVKYQPTEVGSVAWVEGRGEFINPASARHNQVWTMGWNLSPGVGGRVVGGSETAMGLGFECYYNPGGGIEDMEHHLYFVTSDGVQHRPMSWAFRRPSGIVEGNFAGTAFRFTNEIGSQSCFWIRPAAGGTGDTLIGGGGTNAHSLIFNFNNGIAAYQLNGAQNANTPLFYLDNTNVFRIMPNGEATRIGGNVGFNNTAPIAKPNITGSRGGNAALANLLTALANYGLITDGTTA